MQFGDKNYLTPQIKRAWLRPDGVPLDTITHPYNPEEFIEPQNIVDYILANPTKKTKGVLNGISIYKSVEELAKTSKTNAFLVTEKPNHILNQFLQSKGNIIVGKQVVNKATKKHHLPISLLQKVVDNLNNYLAILENKEHKFSILLPFDFQGKWIIVGFDKIDNKIGNAKVRAISTVHGRETDKATFVNTFKNNLRWVEKEKTLTFLHSLRYNFAKEAKEVLNQVAKIIQNFENPKGDVSNNLGGLEPITTLTPHAEILSLQEKGQLGAWLQGYEPKEYAIVLRGDKGAGKSRLLHQLINLFAGNENKKTAFYSLEIDKNTGLAQKMKAEYFTPSALVNIDCTSATTSIEDLKKVAQSGIYECVAIDSFNKIQNISQKDFEILRKSYPNIIWLVIFQSTTGKVIRGGNMPEYDSAVVLQVNKGGFAIQEKNRYGNTDKIYSVFEQKIVEQDKI